MADKPPRGALVASPNRRRAETHPLINADVDTIHSVLMQLFRGYPASAMDLLDDLRDRDPRVDSVCRTRCLAVQGRSWSVRPVGAFSTDREALEIAGEVERIIREIRDPDSGGWATIVGQAMDGVLRGYSVFEIEWGVNKRGLNAPIRLHWRHPNRFVWDDSYKIRLWDMGRGASGKPLNEEHPDRFLVFSPSAGRASLPTRRGVMLSALFPALFKRNTYRWWIKAAEKWGQPVPILRLPSGAEDQKAEALASINNIYGDWGIVVFGNDQDIKIESLAGSGNFNPDVYARFADLANVEITIGVLGQNLTTEISGGSFAAAKTHQEVRADLRVGDCTELDAFVTTQLVEAILRFNFPGGPDLAYQTDAGQHGAPAEIAQALEIAAKRGFRPTDGAIKSLLSRMGVELEPIPEDEREPAPPADPAPAEE